MTAILANPLFNPHDPVGMFDWSVTPHFTEDTLRCLITAGHGTFDRCHAVYAREGAHDLWPHERRIKFDSEWIALAGQYDGMSASWEVMLLG